MQKKSKSIEFFNSGYITHRNRRIGIVWSGEKAEHLMKEMKENPGTHPFAHCKIQQLAKKVKEWEKKGESRHVGEVTDNSTNHLFRIIVVFMVPSLY